jgi:DNA-binding protein HU-beta
MAAKTVKTAKKAAPKAKLTKAGLINAIADVLGEDVSRKSVKAVLETLAEVGYKELKKNGLFVIPGFAKYVVVKKAAKPAREGKNPFTGEPTVFKAKPATKVVRVRPVKALKDAIAG